MKSIVIVPTSHVAPESLRAVERVISQERPDCIAVELDINRFMAMESGGASSWQAIRQMGVWSFLMFLILRRVQAWLGRRVGVMPGSEMLSAVRIAEQGGIHVEFIDRDIGITLQGFRGVPGREKAKLILFLFKGLTLDSIMARLGRAGVARLDLRRVPPRKVIEEVLGVMEREFPGIYRTLVTERDAYMAGRLAALSGSFGKVVAVVGAAHLSGLQRILGQGSGGL
jgi:pheromone shutdown protein TraB